MNFFEQQEKARRRSNWLVFFFALAVLLTAALVSIAFGVLLKINDWRLLIYVGTGVVLTIVFGSLWKLRSLSEGGVSVALMLGGRLLDHESAKSPQEKQLLNVVEEMAIASGAPVPPVFLMEAESGINAFAAGFRPQDAVIGITKGAVEAFNRDELQSVIAHEFSHIVNGDMKLNMRLMGFTYGLFVLTLLGRIMLQPGGNRAYTRGRSKNFAAIAAAGLALFILGWIGYFWGRIFQSSVSRQREFLADASSVQFTRNPEGLIGALTKIGKTAMGSLMINEHSEEARHFFFSNAFTPSWFSLFETHPPLEERIKAINPHIQVAFQNFDVPAESPPSPYIIERFSKPITQRAHDILDVQPMIVALVVSGAKNAEDILKKISGKRGDAFADKVSENLKEIRESKETKLNIFQICLPTLASYSAKQLEELHTLVFAITQLNPQCSVFDFSVLTILEAKRKAAARLRPVVQFQAFSSLKQEMGLLLSTLAYISKSDDLDAYRRGGRILKLADDFFVERSDCKLSEATKALEKFSHASIALKKKLIEAFTATALSDAVVNSEEWEFLRAASIALDCPLPPLMDSKPRAAGRS